MNLYELRDIYDIDGKEYYLVWCSRKVEEWLAEHFLDGMEYSTSVTKSHKQFLLKTEVYELLTLKWKTPEYIEPLHF